MALAIRDEVIEELLQGYRSPEDLLGEEGLFKKPDTTPIAGLYVGRAPPPAIARLFFQRSAKPRPIASRPLQLVPLPHMRQTGARQNGASTSPPRWRGRRSNPGAAKTSPVRYHHFSP